MSPHDPSLNRNRLAPPEEDRWRAVTVSRAAFLVRRAVDSMPGNAASVVQSMKSIVRESVESSSLPNQVSITEVPAAVKTPEIALDFESSSTSSKTTTNEAPEVIESSDSESNQSLIEAARARISAVYPGDNK